MSGMFSGICHLIVLKISWLSKGGVAAQWREYLRYTSFSNCSWIRCTFD